MFVIGLMSGTSADGIDAALCEITGAPPALSIQTRAALFVPFEADFQRRIHHSGSPQTSRVDHLCRLHFELGERFAQAALQVIAAANLAPADVDLVGLHGQTVWHDVLPDGRVTSTLQLSEASILAERTGITTISNFRPRDIAAGGQGAPLTSLMDWLLLRHPTRWRAVQNIGGIGNVTFLPPLNDNHSLPLAFDTGPGNSLMDGVVMALKGERYDPQGSLAEQGRIDEAWLDDLLRHPYYQRKPPKTTGRELFGSVMVEALVEGGKARGLDDAAIIATVTALTAASIAEAYQRFAPAPPDEIIIGGGGKHNRTLMRLLSGMTQAQVLSHEEIGMDSDSKEAVVFALLAYESWHARPGNHPALTGASHPVVLGQITPGANYIALIQRTWC